MSSQLPVYRWWPYNGFDVSCLGALLPLAAFFFCCLFSLHFVFFNRTAIFSPSRQPTPRHPGWATQLWGVNVTLRINSLVELPWYQHSPWLLSLFKASMFTCLAFLLSFDFLDTLFILSTALFRFCFFFLFFQFLCLFYIFIPPFINMKLRCTITEIYAGNSANSCF